ncbi:hypothetical protein [Pontibacter rugosus]
MRFLKGMKAALLFPVCLGWLGFEGQAQVITNNGASIFVSGGAVLTVKGSFVNSVSGAAVPSVDNNGTIQVSENWQLGSPALYTGTGALELNGTSVQQISGTTVHNLTVNNPAGVTQLDNLTVTGNVTITDGNLTAAAGKTLNLEGAISETPDKMYEGALAKTVQVTTVTASSSFGNIGISFDNTDGGNWGNVTVIRHTGPGSYISNPNSPSLQGINRNWSIESEFKPDRKTIALTLSWFTEEDNGLTFPGNQAQVWKSEDDGLTWIRVEGLKPITTNGNVRSVTVQTNSTSLWTVADEITPLPVTWLHFNGKATDTGTELRWATASEKDTESFVVERGLDGRDFHSVASWPLPATAAFHCNIATLTVPCRCRAIRYTTG